MRWRTVVGLVLFRLVNALLVQTSFVPDEYWQSLEVAHYLVYGQGHLTWEWTEHIRGYLHPLIFAAQLKGLHWLGADTLSVFPIAARMLQGCLSVFGDVALYSLALRWSGNSRIAGWVLVAWLSSWFGLYTAVRTLSNTMETTVTLCGLALLPPPTTRTFGLSQIALPLALAGLSCLIRPTAAIPWALAFGLRARQQSARHTLVELSTAMVPVALLTVLAGATINWLVLGKWVLVQWNFLRFNFLSVLCRGGSSAFYGQNPLLWYFYNGWPTVLGFYAPVCLLGLWAASSNLDPAWICLGTTMVLSAVSHKEHRFLLPLLPLASLYVGTGFHWLADRKHYRRIAGALISANLVMSGYFSLVHQRGPLDVMAIINNATEPDAPTKVFFLMPCHSTPLYSYLRRDIKADFLRCPPPTLGPDESSEFHRSPLEWVQLNFDTSGLIDDEKPRRKALQTFHATHLVVYSTLIPTLSSWFKSKGYRQCGSVFHAHFPVETTQGTHIIVLCK